jgi:prevent-host-death family protein
MYQEMYLTMRKIIPITDLQRQAGQVVTSLADSDEPVVVTQRGRAAAVIVSIERYQQIEEDLERLDELELSVMVELGRAAKRAGDMLSHADVKRRLGIAPVKGTKSLGEKAGTKRKARV